MQRWWLLVLKRRVLVRHVLSHSAGLSTVLPPTLSPAGFNDWAKVRRALETAPCDSEPGEVCTYHAVSFGWLVAGIVEAVTGNSIQAFVAEHIAEPLGLRGRFYMGLPPKPKSKSIAAVTAGTRGFRGALGRQREAAPPEGEADCRPWDRLATISFPLFETLASSGMGLDKGGADGAMEDKLSAFMSDLPLPEGMTVEDLKSQMEAQVEGQAEDSPGGGFDLEAMRARISGKEHLLDLRLWNHPLMRSATAPAANGHFTAEALALFYHEAIVQGRLLSFDAADACIGARTEASIFGAAADAVPGLRLRVPFGLGFQLFQRQSHPASAPADASVWTGMGHLGIGGSLAVCERKSGVSIAITMNQLVPDSGPTRQLLAAIFRILNVEPISLPNAASPLSI